LIILTLRTDKPVSEIGLYKNYEKLDYIEWMAHRQLAETINYKITEILKTNSYSLEDIEGIVIFKGPGSFTGLRIGISTANALAYGLGVAIIGSLGQDWIKDGISELLSKKSDKVVLPEYGGEIHITKPKK
jgi:tRNA threonylcarbamoyladenosine biosynthesis protein TsaB